MSRDDRPLTLIERMMSATTGSLITSLILTPMDVVRIRLQQQDVLPECVCEFPGIQTNLTKGKLDTFNNPLTQVNVSQLNRPDGQSNKFFQKKIFWEGPCYTELKCQNSAIRFKNTTDAFYRITQLEGITTLWRGISLTLLMAIPSNIVYFTGYEYIRDKSPISELYPKINPLLCGAIARIIAATTVAPIELIKTKFQSIPTTSKTTNSLHIFKDLLRDTRIEIGERGVVQSLFKGLEITLWRDVPFSAIYWCSYETCKKQIWFPNETHNNTIHFINSFMSGSISGTIAALVTHPFDVGKTRQQISLLGNGKGNNRGANTVRNRNMFKFLNQIRIREGWKSLYTGLGPRLVKIAPSCAIMISTYEISKKIINSQC